MEMVTFGKIFEAWKAEKMLYVKESSMATYLLLAEKHLLPVFKDATEIKERDAQAFVIQKLQNGLSQKTTKDCIIVLRMILRYADKNDWWICRPWDLRYPPVKNVKKLSVMSQKEQKTLMNYLAMNYSLRNLGILICLNTGMRIGEVCGLQWGDINLNERCITISRSVSRVYYPSSNGQHRTFLSIGTPKTESSNRIIPISDELIELIKISKRYSHPDYYVLTNKPKPIEPRTYRNHFKQVLKGAGLPQMHFHTLRHTFATRCIESNCDVKTVSSILGHTNISTTLNVYVHPNMEHKRKCIDQMLESLRQ